LPIGMMRPVRSINRQHQEIDLTNLATREYGSRSILRKIEATFGAILFASSAAYYVGGLVLMVFQGAASGA
jgi:hypothetical protein